MFTKKKVWLAVGVLLVIYLIPLFFIDLTVRDKKYYIDPQQINKVKEKILCSLYLGKLVVNNANIKTWAAKCDSPLVNIVDYFKAFYNKQKAMLTRKTPPYEFCKQFRGGQGWSCEIDTPGTYSGRRDGEATFKALCEEQGGHFSIHRSVIGRTVYCDYNKRIK